jgi:hypothetical protein
MILLGLINTNAGLIPLGLLHMRQIQQALAVLRDWWSLIDSHIRLPEEHWNISSGGLKETISWQE